MDPILQQLINNGNCSWYLQVLPLANILQLSSSSSIFFVVHFSVVLFSYRFSIKKNISNFHRKQIKIELIEMRMCVCVCVSVIVIITWVREKTIIYCARLKWLKNTGSNRIIWHTVFVWQWIDILAKREWKIILYLYIFITSLTAAIYKKNNFVGIEWM